MAEGFLQAPDETPKTNTESWTKWKHYSPPMPEADGTSGSGSQKGAKQEWNQWSSKDRAQRAPPSTEYNFHYHKK